MTDLSEHAELLELKLAHVYARGVKRRMIEEFLEEFETHAIERLLGGYLLTTEAGVRNFLSDCREKGLIP